MKTVKIILAAMIIACASIFTAKADNDRPISFSALPANSQAFVNTHFGGTNISYAKVDRELFDTSYEVFFVNGNKVEFRKNGEWQKVDCLKEAVPAGVVPQPIIDFVNRSHPGQAIVKIDRDRRDYEIELRNGLEIKFDLRFNVIGYDD